MPKAYVGQGLPFVAYSIPHLLYLKSDIVF
nr:MAG TPA: hypothetical protein [Caudoviricetes sp.]